MSAFGFITYLFITKDDTQVLVDHDYCESVRDLFIKKGSKTSTIEEYPYGFFIQRRDDSSLRQIEFNTGFVVKSSMAEVEAVISEWLDKNPLP